MDLQQAEDIETGDMGLSSVVENMQDQFLSKEVGVAILQLLGMEEEHPLSLNLDTIKKSSLN